MNIESRYQIYLVEYESTIKSVIAHNFAQINKKVRKKQMRVP